MIWDCFMFNDELNLLEIRLHHHSFVDRFVLIESTRTYSGLQKPLHYQLNRARFSEFADRIYHIALDFPFHGNGAWAYEHLQRNVLRGFTFGLYDVVIYADCDEIVRGPEVIHSFMASGKDIISLQMELGFYYLNVRVKQAHAPGATYHIAPCFKSKWHMGKILRASLIPAYNYLYEIREHQLHHNPPDLIPNAGWHFSNLGSPERIFGKLKAISHCDDPEFHDLSVDKISERKQALTDPLGRDGVVYETFMDLPDYVLQNQTKFHDYFLS